MKVTGTHIAYLHLCHRKLWLFAHGITMEHTSEVVSEGKLIGETSYADRASRFTEIEIDGVKIDFYDAKRKVIHEVKKSSKMEEAHVAQVKYYIWKLAQKGITGVTGVIEYPKLKQRENVMLPEKDFADVARWENEARQIMEKETCPPLLRVKLCRSCSYFDFCYSSE